MLQRIQSLYLLGILVVQVLISQFSFLVFTKDSMLYSLTPAGVFDDQDISIISDYKQVFIIIISCVFALVAIVIFKNRKLQMKLIMLLGFICVAQLVFVGVSFYQLSQDNVIGLLPGLATYLIPVCLILAVLARKAVKKDDDLIKSVDRIR